MRIAINPELEGKHQDMDPECGGNWLTGITRSFKQHSERDADTTSPKISEKLS